MTQRAARPFNQPSPNPNPTNRTPKTAILSKHLCLMDHHNGFANRFGKGTIALHTPLILQDETVMHGLC